MWHGVETFTLTPSQTKWLTLQSSLTKQLIQRCGSAFQVKVHQEFFTTKIDETFAATELTENNISFFIREVLLIGPEPLVFARSVIPQNTLNTHRIPFLHLGQTSLGTYLFDSCVLNRENIQVAQISKSQFLHQATEQTLHQDFAALWAKSSTFWLDKHPLRVIETFLPAFWERFQEDPI